MPGNSSIGDTGTDNAFMRRDRPIPSELSPMRICLFTETALPKIGGQELVVDALARNLTKWGH